MKKVWISPDSSMAYCSNCLPASGYIEALYYNYSPEIITYMEQNQVKYTKIPEDNLDCEHIFDANKPKITSPIDGTEYYIDMLDSMQVMLSCNVANDVNKIYWYINKRFYKDAAPGEKVFFDPPEGKVEISCTDDKGRASEKELIFSETGKPVNYLQ